MKTENQPPSELRETLNAQRPLLLRAMGFSIVGGLLALASTFYMLEVYDRVVNSRNHLTLAMLTLAVIGAYLVTQVVDWARTTMLQAQAQRLERELAPRIFHLVFEANLRRSAGGTTQPMNDLRTLCEFMATPVLAAIMEAPVAIVFLILIFTISPVLGWAAVAGAVVQVGLAWFNEKSTQPPLTAANRTAMAAQKYADGTLRNAEVIESMGMLRDIHGRWITMQRIFLNLQAKASDSAGAYNAAGKLLQMVLSSMLLGLGAWVLMQGGMSGGSGMMLMASVLGGRLLAPLMQMVGQWRFVVNARDAWSRLEPLLVQFPKRPPSMALPAPRGALAVENVVAGAPDAPAPILRGLQFSLEPGEVLAVVGPSASGKTTLARLLVGVWPTMAGKVRLDGADVYSWDKAALGPHIGYLPQGVELFEGTVAENIARFGNVDRSKVEAAARRVEIHETILALPQGYDSPVGRDGAILSGGQRQRVALARALYDDPEFVVLDEPNSSLDDAGDAALAAAILSLKQRGTTFVVITHRTSILAVVDKMLVLRDGMAQAFGPRDEVLAALMQTSPVPQRATHLHPGPALPLAARP